MEEGRAILKKQAPLKISACSFFGKSLTSFTVCCQRHTSLVMEGAPLATVTRLCNRLLSWTASLWRIPLNFLSSFGSFPFSISFPNPSPTAKSPCCACRRRTFEGATQDWERLLRYFGLSPELPLMTVVGDVFSSFSFSVQAWNFPGMFSAGCATLSKMLLFGEEASENLRPAHLASVTSAVALLGFSSVISPSWVVIDDFTFSPTEFNSDRDSDLSDMLRRNVGLEFEVAQSLPSKVSGREVLFLTTWRSDCSDCFLSGVKRGKVPTLSWATFSGGRHCSPFLAS